MTLFTPVLPGSIRTEGGLRYLDLFPIIICLWNEGVTKYAYMVSLRRLDPRGDHWLRTVVKGTET